MREIRLYGSEGREAQTNAPFLPLSKNVGYRNPFGQADGRKPIPGGTRSLASG